MERIRRMDEIYSALTGVMFAIVGTVVSPELISIKIEQEPNPAETLNTILSVISFIFSISASIFSFYRYFKNKPTP